MTPQKAVKSAAKSKAAKRRSEDTPECEDSPQYELPPVTSPSEERENEEEPGPHKMTTPTKPAHQPRTPKAPR